jgi:WD repeat-containing protein 19
MQLSFVLDASTTGRGPILTSWSNNAKFAAIAGSNKYIIIVDNNGALYEKISPLSLYACTGLEWNRNSTILAILQSGAPQEVFLWNVSTKQMDIVNLELKDVIFMKWSTKDNLLAFGTSKGDVAIYDQDVKELRISDAKHKKRITCGDWSHDNKFAFASDDRQISIIDGKGKSFGQVKVKSRPTSIKFAGTCSEKLNTISVCMDRKTILLYDLDDPENALELAFQPRYGTIISFQWFKGSNIVISFSLGFLVVISTNLSEIGREQFCRRFDDDVLRDMAHCSFRQYVAICNDSCIKIIDMQGWSEWCKYDFHSKVGSIERVEWADHGKKLSVGTRIGYFYVFNLECNVLENGSEIANSSLLIQLMERPFSDCSFVMTVAIAFVLMAALTPHFFNQSLFNIAQALMHGAVV